MDFKIKFFDSANLNEIETRRFKIKFHDFDFFEFMSYLKSIYDIEDKESIFIYWNNNSHWVFLNCDNDWDMFVKENEENSNKLVSLCIYYGNVHTNITCDICEYTVIGDRYKCLQCVDYDICQMCMKTKSNIHKEHCMLLLRSPADSLKYLRTVKMSEYNGGCDFRVIDVDFTQIPATGNASVNEMGTQTETIVQNKKEDSEMEASMSGTLPSENGVKECFLSLEDSSICKDDLNKLPPNIQEGLQQLRGMGFKNINGPLIALLIEKNGSVVDVIEELEYSLKK